MSKHQVRLFMPGSFEKGQTVPCDKKQSHYLCNVMRLKEKSLLTVFNGHQGEWRARLHKMHKNEAQILLEEQVKPQSVARVSITLMFSPLKSQKQYIIDEKCTELGVTCFQPVKTDYGQTGRFNNDKMKAHCIEASEQCGRMDIPDIKPMESLKAVLLRHDHNVPLLFCNEREEGQSLMEKLHSIGQSTVAILIGPEGGFSDGEIEFLTQFPFVHSISLGKNILRAETAALLSTGICAQILSN